jgi:biopolymer transport protein ExbD
MAAKLAGPRGRKFILGQNSDMNVTPFVDVMLVLLIVFMVTAPLATTAIRIDLPKNVQSSAPKAFTYVSIADDGRIFVSASATQMRASSLDALGDDLAKCLGGPDPTGRQIFIRADAHVKYGRFMAVIDRLKSDGYARIGLISEEA